MQLQQPAETMGYHVISFAYDDVERNPALCMTMLRMVISRHQSSQSPISRVMLSEKEVMRLAIQQAEPIRSKDMEKHFEIDHKTAVNLLRKLCAKGWLLPSYRGNRERIVRCELAHDFSRYLEE
jgi:DNA-binding MarR family transcriptional regulator